MKIQTLIVSFFILLQFTSCSKKISQPNYNNQESEVISDGYSTTTAHNKTGAGSSIEHQKTILKLDDHLRGLAGVNVIGSGSGATIRVRGVNSFESSSTEPLFVLNGVAMPSYASTYSAVNPIDIKRVTVLTDASSTAIYGVRGANGVIIVTLKNTK